MAIGAILAALLGAGGSIAGGLLSERGSQQQTKTQTPPSRDPFSDPVTAAASFDVLSNLGIVDPTVLYAAGPLQRAIQGLQRQTVGIKDVDFLNFAVPMLQAKYEELENAGLLGSLNDLLNPSTTQEKDSLKRVYSDLSLYNTPRKIAMLIGQENPDVLKTTTAFIDRLSQVAEKLQAISGMSLGELFASQRAFQSNVDARSQSLGNLAAETMRGREAAARTRAQLLTGLQDNLASLRGQELARLNSQYDLAADRLLRTANAAGFNPGRTLGDLERSRVVDADLEALNRAVNLITGQGNLLNLISGQPIDQSTQLGSVRAGGSVAQPGATTTTPQSQLGSGIAQAVPAGLLSYNIAKQIQSGGPGAQNLSNLGAVGTGYYNYNQYEPVG
jgi:hypothetical protein